MTKKEQEKAWKAWLLTRPENVRKVAEFIYPGQCYRMKSKRGHYAMVYGCGYHESKKEDGHVTVSLAHGRDSFLPGVMVFGFLPEELELCGCGKWEMPSPLQVEKTTKKLNMYKQAKARRLS